MNCSLYLLLALYLVSPQGGSNGMLAALGAVGNLMYNVEAIAKLDKYIRVSQLDKLPVCLQVANTVNVRACSDTRTVFLKLRDSTCRGRLLLQKSVSKSLKKNYRCFILYSSSAHRPFMERKCVFSLFTFHPNYQSL